MVMVSARCQQRSAAAILAILVLAVSRNVANFKRNIVEALSAVIAMTEAVV